MKGSRSTAEERAALVRALRRCYWSMQALLDARVKKEGITDMQFQLLWALHQRGALTAGNLCDVLEVTPADVTGLATRLERKGLLRRARDGADHRVVVLSLSPKGERAVVRGQRLRDRLLDEILRSIPEEERARSLKGLEGLLLLLEERNRPEAPTPSHAHDPTVDTQAPGEARPERSMPPAR